jgi:hypothetical protein
MSLFLECIDVARESNYICELCQKDTRSQIQEAKDKNMRPYSRKLDVGQRVGT